MKKVVLCGFFLVLFCAFALAQVDLSPPQGPPLPPSAVSVSAVLSVQYPASDVLCAHAGDTSISGITCNNLVTDDISTAQNFATTVSIPGGLLTANKSLRVTLHWATWTAASASTVGRLKYLYGTATLVDTSTGTLSNSFANIGQGGIWNIGTQSTTLLVSNVVGVELPGVSSTNINNATQPVTVTTTNTTQSLAISSIFTAKGLAAVASVTGGTVTGTAGQTCLLATFNGSCSGSTATATLVSTDTIAGATFVVSNTGQACASAPTTVTLTSGTATCSGSGLTTSTTLGGAQGNAIRLVGMVVELL